MKVENANAGNIRKKMMDSLAGIDKEKLEKYKSKDGKKSVSSDMASISNEAQILSKAVSELRNVPETREALITELREQIMSGNYQINYDQLADILKGILQ